MGVEDLEVDLLAADDCPVGVMDLLGEKAPVLGCDLIKGGTGDAEGDLALLELAEGLAGETPYFLCGLGLVYVQVVLHVDEAVLI